MSKSSDEFERARKALIAAGFSNSACVELLTERRGLRDRIAEAALIGLLSSHANPNANDPYMVSPQVAETAYAYADRMLEARRND